VEKSSELDYQSSRAAGVPTKELALTKKKESLGRGLVERGVNNEEHKSQKI
jgi:hypothetical protein